LTPKDVMTAISSITTQLIELGVCDDQNFATELNTNNETHITFSGFSDVSIALKDIVYSELYEYLLSKRQFNFRLLDGGLIQIMYCFGGNQELLKHRLCYFPSPNFEAFQNDPSLYMDESVYYADVILKSILPVPIRFDFDPSNFTELEHPACHLSLGQYKNCRIPTFAPICPANFINFILRSFYYTATSDLSIKSPYILMDETITKKEKGILHLAVV
jgi:hypothetical protein